MEKKEEIGNLNFINITPGLEKWNEDEYRTELFEKKNSNKIFDFKFVSQIIERYTLSHPSNLTEPPEAEVEAESILNYNQKRRNFKSNNKVRQ